MNPTRPTMLVVDDQRDMGEFIADVGTENGFDPVVITRPEILRRELQPPWPDVLVLDVVMPEFDGIEVVRLLGMRKVPTRVILTSGNDRRYLQATARIAEANGVHVCAVMEKPIHLEALERTLDAARADLVADASP